MLKRVFILICGCLLLMGLYTCSSGQKVQKTQPTPALKGPVQPAPAPQPAPALEPEPEPVEETVEDEEADEDGSDFGSEMVDEEEMPEEDTGVPDDE